MAMVVAATGLMGFSGKAQAESIPKLDRDELPASGPDSARSTVSGDGSSATEPWNPEALGGSAWFQTDATESVPMNEVDAWHTARFAGFAWLQADAAEFAWPPIEASESPVKQPNAEILEQRPCQEVAHAVPLGFEQLPFSAQSMDHPLGLELGEPLGKGSTLHAMGLCKPCAFAYKGCRSGLSCEFCHLCPPGEHKRRVRQWKYDRWFYGAGPAGGRAFRTRSRPQR